MCTGGCGSCDSGCGQAVSGRQPCGPTRLEQLWHPQRLAPQPSWQAPGWPGPGGPWLPEACLLLRLGLQRSVRKPPPIPAVSSVPYGSRRAFCFLSSGTRTDKPFFPWPFKQVGKASPGPLPGSQRTPCSFPAGDSRSPLFPGAGHSARCLWPGFHLWALQSW